MQSEGRETTASKAICSLEGLVSRPEAGSEAADTGASVPRASLASVSPAARVVRLMLCWISRAG